MKVDIERKCRSESWGRPVKSSKWKISIVVPGLLTAGVLIFLSSNCAHPKSGVVEFDIPASTQPQALRAFARQSRIELVFAERGYDDVMTRAVVGAYRRERALEMLLAGTGLSVGFGSGDSVIVQRPQPSKATPGLAAGRLDDEATLLAQVAVGSAEESRGQSCINSQAAVLNRNPESSEVLEEIIATGSRIRGAQSASPVVTVIRQEIDRVGSAAVEDVIEKLPQNLGAGATLDTTNTTNKFQAACGCTRDFAGGTSIDLRGLGVNVTLVLLNGRRPSPDGTQAGFTNIGSIPVTAIESVEVMTDGASAVYGTDAIAGVINFILREEYEGAETRLRYGNDADGDTSDVLSGQTFGTSWNSGNVLLSYEYFGKEPLAGSDRAFTASSDLTLFGSTDWRRPGGSPANIIAGGQPFAIPDGQDGTALTSADFRARVFRGLKHECPASRPQGDGMNRDLNSNDCHRTTDMAVWVSSKKTGRYRLVRPSRYGILTGVPPAPRP